MDTEALLLRAICENPDDDTPRLVFADFLQEQDDRVSVSWAELIRAQIWAAAHDGGASSPCPEADSLVTRELVRERVGLALPAQVRAWDRGFPCALVNPIAELRYVWPRVAYRVPIRSLRITGASEKGAAEFATWAGLEVIRELEVLFGWDAGASHSLSWLVGCAGLRGVRELVLDWVNPTDEGAVAILDAPHLTSLKKLRWHSLSLSQLSAPVVRRLAARFGPEVIDDGSNR
ncbi:MAG: TIGR02996 domain-containing protein [Gemmataceae bacterium]|nr:TIGR02996 domain-containing protein [Gemmataceae bacterium]